MFIDVEIQTIHDEYKIMKALKQFDKITKIDITLHPSNPSNRDRWEKTDEKIQKMKVKKFKQSYYGDNIIVDENSEVVGDIFMAGDGYGVATIKGQIDEKDKIVSTDKVPVRDFAGKEEPHKIVEKLSKTFKKILERFDKNED